jgi:hypothetical protein
MWSVGTERPCVGRGGLEGRASAGSARAERVRSLGAISGSLSPFVLFIVLTAHIDSSRYPRLVVGDARRPYRARYARRWV